MTVLGPFPCGASKCLCTRGGCEDFGLCKPDQLAHFAKRSLECGRCGITYRDQDPDEPCEAEDCGAIAWREPQP